MNYLIPIYMLGMLLLGIRAAYLARKFLSYLKTHHPEIVKDFVGLTTLKFSRSLHRGYDIEDPEFQRLRKKAKNAEDLLCLSFLIPIVIIVCIVLFSYLFSS